ncbi:hypothetical protein EJB05_22477, partial [Eragrostis curvula]
MREKRRDKKKEKETRSSNVLGVVRAQARSGSIAVRGSFLALRESEEYKNRPWTPVLDGSSPS